MNDQPVLPPDPDPSATQALPAQGPTTPPAAKQPLRDRLWSLRAMIAVALASVVIGGLGGAALASASGDDGDLRRGPGGFQRGGPGGPPGGKMSERRREWLEQWRDQRGTDPRDRRPDNRPGVPLAPVPSPSLPTPSN